jgi:type IV fimbrial biogenesis protein FimT
MTHINVQKGFTLVEMLATIAVATVLLGIATPSFMDMTRRNRTTTYSNDLIATINLARSEAIRRGTNVSICHTSNGSACAAANTGAWGDGWLVFTDANGNGSIDAADKDTILRTHEGLATKYTLASAKFKDNIIYNSDGAANDTGVFAVCFNSQLKDARAVIVTRLRPRTARDTTTPPDGIPNTDTGNLASCTAP